MKLLTLLSVLAVLCTCTAAPGQADECATGKAGGACCCAAATKPTSQPVASELTDVERRELLRMRREEKLAHDVYVALGATYKLMPFERIPRSELRHQEIVSGLLDRYGVPDPVRGLPAGEFDEPDFQQLYDALVARGHASEIEALKVGAEIEEMDIRDLRAASAASTKSDLRAVLTNLESASGNHLRAFMRNLNRRGGAYAARHLAQSEFDQIVAGQMGLAPTTAPARP